MLIFFNSETALRQLLHAAAFSLSIRIGYGGPGDCPLEIGATMLGILQQNMTTLTQHHSAEMSTWKMSSFWPLGQVEGM
jgi:hypothetical protein